LTTATLARRQPDAPSFLDLRFPLAIGRRRAEGLSERLERSRHRSLGPRDLEDVRALGILDPNVRDAPARHRARSAEDGRADRLAKGAGEIDQRVLAPGARRALADRPFAIFLLELSDPASDIRIEPSNAAGEVEHDDL